MQTLTKTFSGAQIVIETLNKLGVDSIFGYPGGIVLGVYDELSKQDKIKHYLMRHEQAAVHAAEGYSRVSGKCGVAIVTSGPGATNIVTSVANAYLDGYPLVVITGQVSAELLHKDSFQEVDIIDITKSCTKANFQVKDVKDLQKTLVDAFSVAMSGKKGPVVVDITKNVFSEKADYENSLTQNIIEKNVSDININKAIEAILSAQKPLIVAGGGVILSDASKEIFEFAKLLNIPVVSTMMGLGAYPADDKNYLGMVGIFGHPSANSAVRNSDLIFAVGARFNDRIRCCFPNNELGKKLIHLDINENEISRVVRTSISIVGDAKQVLNSMILKLKNLSIKKSFSWPNDLQFKNVAPLKRSAKMHSFEVMQEINDYIKNKDITVTTEVGQHQVWASRFLQFNSPRKFVTSGGLGTMGFGFPAAIGACIAKKEPVICIAGDGSFQMNIQELAVCSDYKLPVKVFILDNGYLGMVRQFQEKQCEERYFATQISNPDFLKLAESYRAKAIRVDILEDVQGAIDFAFSTEGPVLVDFVVEPKELL